MDAFESFILERVEERKDISLEEIVERLAVEHNIGAAPSTVWRFFNKRGITYKKRRRMLPSSSVPTSSPGGTLGSMANSTSTWNA